MLSELLEKIFDSDNRGLWKGGKIIWFILILESIRKKVIFKF